MPDPKSGTLDVALSVLQPGLPCAHNDHIICDNGSEKHLSICSNPFDILYYIL